MSAESNPETSESVALERLVRTAVDQIGNKTLTVADLLKALSPKPAESAPAPAEPPLPVAITKVQREALERVVEVFGKVVPTERRMLEPTEVSALVEEKETLDELTKMAKTRMESIRTTVFNHLDVEAESSEDFDPEETIRDDKGHWVLPGEARGEADTAKRFTRETRDGSPSLPPDTLKELAEDPEVDYFTHKDYLAVTTQVRVLDENKLMLALKKNPKLVMAIAQATKPGTKTASMYLRKA